MPCTASIFALVLIVLAAAGCTDEPAPVDAEAVVDRALRAHGVDSLDQARVDFLFRGRRFSAERRGGVFRYERRYADSLGRDVREVLSNDDLYRAVDGTRVDLPLDTLRSVEEAVNSVIYFALLPHKLDDPAVQTRMLPPDSVRGEPYDRVEVTFVPEGGGRDYQDRFVYWIHRDRHTVEYLAYDYHTGEGGSRFREAVRPRRVGGVRFADYRNYRAAALDRPGAPIETYPRLLESDSLELVSEIVLDSVRVRALPPH